MSSKKGPLAFLLSTVAVWLFASKSSKKPTAPVDSPDDAPPPGKALTLAAAGLPWDGSGYGDTVNRLALSRFIYPGDTQSAALAMLHDHSSCLTFSRGAAAAANKDGMVNGVDVLRRAYQPIQGSIETLLSQWAKAKGVYMLPGLDKPVLIGDDIAVIGWGGSAPDKPGAPAYDKWMAEWGGIAHGMVVTGPMNGDMVPVVQGGQVDHGNPGHSTGINTAWRELVSKNGHWWLGGRRLNYIIRASKVPQRKSA